MNLPKKNSVPQALSSLVQMIFFLVIKLYIQFRISPSLSKSSLEYGRDLHFLLEKLPFYSSDSREKVAHLLLKKSSVKDKKTLSKLIQTALNLLENQSLSFLFGKGSSGEVPLMGTIKGQRISGRIDRLIIAEKEIWAVDYKSDKDVPTSAISVKSEYRMQLSLYAELLKKIYPTTPIKISILWIETADFMELPLISSDFFVKNRSLKESDE